MYSIFSPVLLFFIWNVAECALKLPSYIKPCVRPIDDFDACALKNANDAIPQFSKGDRFYHLPTLDPLEIENIEVNDGGPSSPTRLNIQGQKLKIIGLRNARMVDIHYDFDANTIHWVLKVDTVTATAKYNVSGQILIVPIRGNGDFNLTCTDMILSYKIFYDKAKKKDGFNYMVVKDTALEYNMTRAFIYLDNLFNGNRELGRDVNAFLNNNWKDAVQAVGPILTEAVKVVFKNIVDNFVEYIPFDTFFPEIK